MTVRDALAEAAVRVARRDAETLLAHLLGSDRAWIFAHPDAELAAEQAEVFREIVERRWAHEPLQQLTGVQEFYGLLLRVTRDTLIPRPETELLVEAVIGWAAAQDGPLRIVDVGTGTGAIALALATHLEEAEIIAGDVSAAALAVARDNATRLGLSERVQFVEADLLYGFKADGEFDIVVSNPPYIPLSDASTLQAEVVDYEPHGALFGGEDGLEMYRRLIPQAFDVVRPGGLLAMEFGFGQREDLRGLLARWSEVRFLDDYAGIPRVVLATKR